MTTITALPTAPSRADTANFATRADAWITQFTNITTGEINTVAGEVNANAASAASQVALAAAQVTVAAAQATSAANSATAAASSAAAAGAIAWVSGTTYAIGDARFSLINFQTYRRTTAGAGTTDPSLDSANWTLALVVVSTGSNLYLNNTYGGF